MINQTMALNGSIVSEIAKLVMSDVKAIFQLEYHLPFGNCVGRKKLRWREQLWVIFNQVLASRGRLALAFIVKHYYKQAFFQLLNMAEKIIIYVGR